jgi:hypothetical protein
MGLERRHRPSHGHHVPVDRLARRARTFGPVPAAELSDDDWQHVLMAPTLVGLPDVLASHLAHVLSFDEYVIAVLGHLSWRTPFAEHMGPAGSWLDEPDERVPALRGL